MSSEEQETIRAGHGTIVVDVASNQKVCEFNMKTYRPPRELVNIFTRALFPMIRDHYSKEENRCLYQEHIAKEKE